MDGAQVLEVVLLGQDEHHSVVTVPPARVNLSEKGIVIQEALTHSTSKSIEIEMGSISRRDFESSKPPEGLLMIVTA